MVRVEFQALEYRADTSFGEARWCFDGSPAAGWTITRDGRPHLELGPGYRLLRTAQCGVCSTDLQRHRLPFALPQVTGHELVALDEHGRRYVVEINASHRARGRPDGCPFCAGGLPTHCPERLVLGIHDLPGGFGPWILAPVEAALALPDGIPTSSAVLIEPFAAALRAVTTLFESGGDRAEVECVAVLGPRRLGLLVVAALAGWRARQGRSFEILALSRHASLLDLARELGATRTIRVEGAGLGLPDGLADVVIDTTGHPHGLELAVRLARGEVHLKSTHGLPAAGLVHTTELVVDELALAGLQELARAPGELERLGRGGRARIAWLLERPPPAELSERAELVLAADAASALETFESQRTGAGLPRADAAVVAAPDQVDAVIRPRAGSQASLVRPRGTILLDRQARAHGSRLIEAVARGGLRLSSSRCGDFRAALELMAGDPALLALGERLVTHRFASGELARAFAVARTPACIKAVVEFPPPSAPPSARLRG